ncbi:MAG TPA: ABC transporter permease [Nocardioides sp.]|jgi:peptide/nickel transport system permease protein|nr:ABC transporter permease [Nocardioides sp.]
MSERVADVSLPRRATRMSLSSRAPKALLWLFGAAVLLGGLTGVVVLLTPSLHHLYERQDLTATFQGPMTDGHLLGTDNLGRDLFWRSLAGLGVSLVVGVGVAVISLAVGLVIGILAGFFGKVADVTATVVVDVTWAFPAILLAIVLTGARGPGLVTVVMALALTSWAGFARLVRGEVLALREREFVSAALVLGVSKVRVSVRHFLPALLPLSLVMGAFFVSTSVAAEAGLSFLGLGTQPPTPSLGSILADGRLYLPVSPWPIIVAGSFLAATVTFFNTVGDRLRDTWDPREVTRP